jgi:hypothetical protein
MAFNNINQIIFEDINDEYGYGKYGNFEVIIRKRDGYINATKLCRDGRKQLSHWIRNDNSKNLVKFLGNIIGKTREELIQCVMGNTIYTGTYVHPKLIPHIASWVSHEFALMVSDIVNEHIIREYKIQMKQKDDKIDNLERTMKEIKDKNDEMIRKMDKVLENNDILNENIELLKETNNIISGKLTGVEKELKVAEEKLDVANENIILMNGELKVAEEKLDVANENIILTYDTLKKTANQRVPQERVPSSEKECLIIYFNPKNIEYPFSVFRGQKRSFSLKKKFTNEELAHVRIIFELKENPNPVEVWNRVKQTLRTKISWSNNQFKLDTITEEELIQEIEKIYEERLKPIEEVEEKINEVKENMFEEQEQGENDNKRYELFEEYMKKTLVNLKKIAKDMKLKGFSTKKKNELVELIIENL